MKLARLARPVSGSWRASQASLSISCLRSVMSDTEQTTAASCSSWSSSGRALTDNHWSRPSSSRTPSTMFVVDLAAFERRGDRKLVGGERPRRVVARNVRTGEDRVAPGLVQPASEHPYGRLVRRAHRTVSVHDDDAFFESGDRGCVAALDRESRTRCLFGELALGHVAHDHLEGGLATPAGADTRHFDRDLHAVGPDDDRLVTLHGVARLGQLHESLERRLHVVRVEVRRDRLAHVRHQVLADDLRGGGVGVDDLSVLVHDDRVGRVLDEQLEASGHVDRDPRAPRPNG